jgi:hypothetical protein
MAIRSPHRAYLTASAPEVWLCAFDYSLLRFTPELL